MLPISLRPLFALMDRIVAEEQNARREQARPSGPCTALDRHMERHTLRPILQPPPEFTRTET